ncbi:MAG: hypothetical protein ACRDJW_07605 [Thermomicrobiales bacterium]
MPNRSSKNKPRDLNALAAAIVDEATDEDASEPEDDGKDPNAVALGRKGGAKGGPARAAKLSPERRREIAKQAAAARWAKVIAEADQG